MGPGVAVAGFEVAVAVGPGSGLTYVAAGEVQAVVRVVQAHQG